MWKSLFGRLGQHWRHARATGKHWRQASATRRKVLRRRANHFRPLLEGLESRDLMAFNLTISAAATAGVATQTVSGTTTFVGNANGANVSLADIDNELAAGRNVAIDSGNSGTQAGNISTSGFASHVFPSGGGSLTIRTGTGANLVGDVTLAGLRLGNSASLVVQADDDVTVTNVTSAGTMTIIAPSGSISTTGSGQLRGKCAVTNGGQCHWQLCGATFGQRRFADDGYFGGRRRPGDRRGGRVDGFESRGRRGPGGIDRNRGGPIRQRLWLIRYYRLGGVCDAE